MQHKSQTDTHKLHIQTIIQVQKFSFPDHSKAQGELLTISRNRNKMKNTTSSHPIVTNNT